MPRLELISFALCPYVQRSVITLKKKNVPFSITYIDLNHPPEWFDKISPLGKVPVLKVDEETAIFESAVINEYIDEITGEPLMAKDPLQRAFERAWIAYGSELLMSQYDFTLEEDSEVREEKRREFFESLSRLESVLSVEGPFFRGKDFSLVDAAYAPLFTRLLLSEVLQKDTTWNKIPRTRSWANHLNQDLAVKDSVTSDFADQYIASCKEMGSIYY